MGKGARGVSKFALVASAVSASSWRFSKSRTGNLHRAAEGSAAVEYPEILAVREGIQRPCGSEESRYRQRCQGVQVSDGLGQHYFNCVVGEKKKKGETLFFRSNPEEQKRTRDIPGDTLYLRDPRQILPICFSEPCPKIHDTTTSTSVRKAQCKDAKWPCKELSRRPATAKRGFPSECFVRPRQGDQIPILIS